MDLAGCHSEFFLHTVKAKEWGQKSELISFFNQNMFSMGVINNNLFGHSFSLKEVMLLIGIIFELCSAIMCTFPSPRQAVRNLLFPFADLRDTFAKCFLGL